jgi:hypothetical protein
MSRRIVAASAVAVALFAAGAVAYAQGAAKTYTDAQNRFSFQYPGSLPVDVVDRPNQPLNILVGAADYECQMFVVPRPESASSAPDAVVRAYSNALSTDVWKRSADGFALYGRQGTVDSATVDASNFWPVQKAALKTEAGKPVTAAMHSRPGLEVWQFCTSFDTGDHTAAFNQMISTFAGANDAALKAQAEANLASRSAAQQKAEADAAAAAAAGAAAESAKAQKKRPSSGRGRKQD